jgi:tRNA threonylcarbamoyladenosine biosynthesis protein TsaE
VATLEIISSSAKQTQRVGAELGCLTKAGDVILLEGGLGVGKTCLAQGIARGLGIEEYVTSPSFVLLREHLGRLPLYHIDFYRLDRVEEVAHLGLDDYLYGGGVCVVEWAEKGFGALPDKHLLIEMQYLAPTKRKLTFIPRGARYDEMLSQFKSAGSIARK